MQVLGLIPHDQFFMATILNKPKSINTFVMKRSYSRPPLRIEALPEPLDDIFSVKDNLTEEDLDHLGVRQRRWHADPGFEMLNLDD